VALDFTLPMDVCIVGFPNTGKSRLLTLLTNSKVKVAEHPFSTQRPSLGTYIDEDFMKIVFCEMPSLVAGSSRGKGLGNKFIKHAASAKIMVYLLDPTSRFSHSIEEEYKCLRDEIGAYDPALKDKPVVIAINKIDAYDRALLKDMQERFENLYPTFLISLETKEGLPELIAGIKQAMKEVPGL
jgi:GTP-binding protein